MSSQAQAADWGTLATISSTMGANANRLCLGEGTRATDIGCPSYAPYVSATSGYVGIGTSAPGSKLEVSGNIGITSAGRFGYLPDNPSQYFTKGGINIAHYGMSIGDAWGVGGYENHLSGYRGVGFYTLGTERMRIVQSGLIGMGIITPTTALEVSGTISATNFVGDGSGLTGVVASTGDRIVSGTTSMIAVSNTGFISLTQAGTNTGWFDPTYGLVTIGVSSTGGISGTTGYFSGNVVANGKVTASSFWAGTGLGMYWGTGGPDNIVGNGTSHFVAISTSGTEAMRIVSTGYVGIGTSSPTAKLQVNGDLYFGDASGNSTMTIKPVYTGAAYPGGTNLTVAAANTVASTGNGGTLTLMAGDGGLVTAGNGGDIVLKSGAGKSVTGSIVFKPGGSGAASVFMDSALATFGYKPGTGSGNIQLKAGASTDAAGGNTYVTAGAGGTTGNNNGGNVIIAAGAGGNSGAPGYVQISGTARIASWTAIGWNSTYAPTAALEVSGTVSATRFVGDGSGLSGISTQGDRIVSGSLLAVANSASGYISLSTAGSTWGYLGSAVSYLPNVSTTNSQVSNLLAFDGQAITSLVGGGGNTIVSGSSSVSVTNAGSGAINFATNGSQRMSIVSTGNVGIGTSSPGARMQIKQSGNSWSGGLQVVRSDATNFADFYIGADNRAYIQAGGAGYIALQSDGNVGIGTTTPGSKLQVNAISAGDGIAVYNTAAGRALYAEDTTAGAGGVGANGGSWDFWAYGSGTHYGSSSSIRWKRNVQPIGDALHTVMELRPVYFNWDKAHGGKHDFGFIAEEVAKVIPNVVTMEADGKFAKGLDYGKVTPYLAGAIHAQQAQISKLQADNDNLRHQVDDLRREMREMNQRKSAM